MSGRVFPQNMVSQPRFVDSRVVKHRHSKLWLWLVWLLILVRAGPRLSLLGQPWTFRARYASGGTSFD